MKNPAMEEERRKFKSLNGRDKVRYIWDYYKLPIAVFLILAYIVGYNIYGKVTHKDVVLYTGLVNVTAGDDLLNDLDGGFLTDTGTDTAKNRMQLYTGLYLTADENSPYYEYVYASRVKILATIDGEQLDVVLMDREAFDAFAQEGYLINMEDFLTAHLSGYGKLETLRSALTTGTAVLEDNATDVRLDPSVEYQAVTEDFPMALELSQAPVIRRAGFNGSVYLGVIANTPRPETAAEYIRYLFED